MIPKTTSPLTKSIRTLEGWVVAVAAAIPWVVALVNPHTLSPHLAAEWSSISAVALVVSRSALKAVAVTKTATGITPATIDLEALAAKTAGKIGVTQLPTTDQVKTIVADAATAASDPAGIVEGATDALEAAVAAPAPPVAI